MYMVVIASALSGQETAKLLPWEREIPLREAAGSVYLEGVLHPTNPAPGDGAYPRGPSMQINNLGIRSTIWGPTNRITISIIKNDVWDRRIKEAQSPTLKEIIEGAYSPANKDFKGIRPNTTRPNWGYLTKEGGMADPCHPKPGPIPMMKPVGQIILGLDDLDGAEAPKLAQSCANGVVKLQASKADAKANLEYVLTMTGNVYAIRGQFTGMKVAVWLRLYRHRDTDETYSLDPPQSGRDGRFFWIRQKLPAEKTFPQGFQYVLMGIVGEPGDAEIETVDGRTGLGTPPPEKAIAAASGSAATAKFVSRSNGKLQAYITVVTTIDAADIMAEAKRRLAVAESAGFDGVAAENARWFAGFYDKRENGRVFYGASGHDATDDIRNIYRSWFPHHGGGTKTDMRKYQASAHYDVPEKDRQSYSGLPCYNEIFYTSNVVRNRTDQVDMWKQIVEHWYSASRDNAREMFGMPGIALLHGYLPPIKPDKYIHTNIALELAVDTVAQMFKPMWDEWDYGGDEKFLREECYPAMRDVCLFYAAYAKKGEDGYYHIIPSMQEECWGIYPEFSHSKDCIAALCMFRWAFLRTAEAAELLGKDADLRRQWREIAEHLAPYPTWQKPSGVVFAGIPGVEPLRFRGDHPWDVGAYPTVLADEINLDSDAKLKETMIRTVRELRSSSTGEALVLLGVADDMGSESGAATQETSLRSQINRNPERLINSRSGRIHLFPCVPAKAEIAFRRFQARGGFLVSACRNADGVTFVEIEARRNTQCKLMNPWPGKSVAVRETGKNENVTFNLDKSNGECIIFPAVAGSTYRILGGVDSR